MPNATHLKILWHVQCTAVTAAVPATKGATSVKVMCNTTVQQPHMLRYCASTAV